MQFHKPQRQPIAAVSPFVMHVTRKAMHQVDSEIADFRLLERLATDGDGNWVGSNSLPLSSMLATSVPALRSNSIAILRRSSFAPPPCIMMLATASSRQS